MKRPPAMRVFDVDAPGIERPVTRGDCEHGCRPCPLLTCKFHLGAEITNVGHMRLHPLLREYGAVKGLLKMAETCVLDVADDGQHDQEEVAKLMGIDQSRVSRWEVQAFRRARTHATGGH